MKIHVLQLALLVLVAPGRVAAQEDAAAAAGSPSETFSQEQLDQILASVALYPDDVLSQVLMAATYPLEIVQAQRWAQENKNLQGDALAVALEKQSWDPSVKSLVNFPQVLQMMSEELDWTVMLGDAVLAQQDEVMATIQKLRVKAQDAGNLASTSQQTVTSDTSGETTVIVIESTEPEVVYVPVYDPSDVYGPWWYPSYPPYYWYPPTYTPRPGLWFSAGVAVGAAWGYAWGDCNWRHGDIDIDIDRNLRVNHHIDRNRYRADFNRGGVGGRSGAWTHNAAHRQGAPYRSANTAARFGQTSSLTRNSYRGFDGLGSPGFGRTGTVTRPSSAASRDGIRPGSPGTRDVSPPGSRTTARPQPTGRTTPPGRSTTSRPTTTQRPSATPSRSTSGTRSGAFSGAGSSRSRTSSYSSRGRSSMSGGRSVGGRR